MQERSTDKSDTRRPGAARWVLVAAAVALAFGAVNLAVWLGFSMTLWDLDVQGVSAWIRSFGPAAAVASCLVMVLCALTVLPAEVPALANGMIFGPWLGAAITWAGAMIGANIAFAVARLLGPGLIDRWISTELSRQYRRRLESQGAIVLLLARCIPLIPFFAVNYLAGAVSMRIWTFNWVTAIGILPMTVALSAMGDQAFEMHWQRWLTLAIALLCLVLALRWLARRFTASDGPVPVLGPDAADEVRSTKE